MYQRPRTLGKCALQGFGFDAVGFTDERVSRASVGFEGPRFRV